jgi:NAD(P)H-nitrite reductase large subunit
MQLKIAGVDLLSVGSVQPAGGGAEIVAREDHPRQYRKLVLHHGQVMGAILLGRSDLFDPVSAAVATGRDVSHALGALAAGDWSVLR